MTVAKILQSVQFMVNKEGKPTAAVLDISVWEHFLSLIEQIEDVALVRSRLKTWRSKEGWTRWEDFETELDRDELPILAIAQNLPCQAVEGAASSQCER